MRRKLTVIITTFNEEDHIEAAIQSVQFADEIIIVDSFSKDRTVEIALKYTDKVWKRDYLGPSDQKNWAIPQAQNEWVLILDADERVSPALETELTQLLNATSINEDAFWIPRQNFFMGKMVRYSGWQNDAVIRLIQRDKCRYNTRQVHEEIETTGLSVGRFNKHLFHYTYKSIDHYLAKTRRYALWSAKDHQNKVKQVTWFHLLFKPLFRFFKHFILQKGFLDGKVGFIISCVMAWGVFLRYLHLMDGER